MKAKLGINVLCPGCGYILAWISSGLERKNLKYVCRGDPNCKFHGREFEMPTIELKLIPKKRKKP